MIRNGKSKISVGSVFILFIIFIAGVFFIKRTFFLQTPEEENYTDFGEDTEEEPEEIGRFAGETGIGESQMITNRSEFLGDAEADNLFADIKKYIEGSFGLDKLGKLQWVFDEYQVNFSDHHADGKDMIDCSILANAYRVSEITGEITEEAETRSFPLALFVSDSKVPFYPHLSLTSEINYKLFRVATPNEEYLPIEEKSLSLALKKYESYKAQIKRRYDEVLKYRTG